MCTLLITDDEEHFITTVKNILHQGQLQFEFIFEARDGFTALEIIKKEEPDVIVTDMKMPYLDGSIVLQKCHELGIKSKIIVISGYDDFRYTKQAIRTGTMDYLLKPVNPDELIELLKKAVKRSKTETENDTKRNSIEKSLAAKIKLYIEENYDKQISIDFLSQKFYASRECILKKFKSAYRMGVYEYVMKLRMEKAHYLLVHYDFQIQEISDKIGFNDSNYFSKAFKKYFGYPPTQVKQPQLPHGTIL